MANPITFQFEDDLDYQMQAIRSTVELFRGLSRQIDGIYRPSRIRKIGEGDPVRNPDIVVGSRLLENLRKVQLSNDLFADHALADGNNFTIEMETGTGKTYVYLRSILELHKEYGFKKFMIVVPSIAIREGVYKTFQVTQDHFAEEYGKKIRFFIYNSSQLTEIDRFASDSSINVMIINSQAFNARGKDARRIYMKLDEFRSRRPIDIIAKTNPVLIIDEPQSVEGKQTKERLKEFHPLLTLRYSATPRDYYNLIYRLDAMDAYNKKLVKKISVKGVAEMGTTATDSFVYLEGLNLSKSAPTATIQFDFKGKSGIRPVSRIVTEGYNLFDNSGELPEYKDGFVVKRIDGRDDSIEFLNGVKLYVGDIVGKTDENCAEFRFVRRLFPTSIVNRNSSIRGLRYSHCFSSMR